MTSKADYLKRYMSDGGGNSAPDDDAKKKKRRRKKDKTDGSVKVKQVGTGVRILDEDADDWKRADDPADANPEEGPVVVDAKDAEVVRDTKARQYLGVKEDGSGWTVAEDLRSVEKSKSDAADDDDLSPPRASGRHDSDDDLSPPRASGRHDSDDSDDDLSPPRERERHDSDDDDEGDLSLIRRERRLSAGGAAAGIARDGAAPKNRSDVRETPRPSSPPRGGGEGFANPATRAKDAAYDTKLSTPSSRRGVMTDGTSAGLVDATTVVREADEKREAAKARIAAMSAEMSGRDAQTLFRDKATGALVDAEELARRQDLARARPERTRPVWGGGIAQEREARERREALAEEASQPFARAEVDARADAAMRAASRFGDPMAHLARKRLAASLDAGASRNVVAGVDADALRRSGFRIPQDVPAHSWMRRGVGAPANRFSIKPGRHWDGVDRGTGFEQEMFKALNDRSAKRQADWKYGQSMWE